MGTCQTGAAEGAACGGNNAMPCAPTLYCDPTSLKCSSSITYAQPGQSCAGGGMGLVLCEVGQCMNGKCPTVVADGQPCGMAGTTCDWFANCTQGTCQLPSAGSCH